MKPTICIVADVPNWAFDNIAKVVQKELSWKYNIKVAYFNRRTDADNFYDFLEENNDCDLIHFLNRRTLLLIDTDIFRKKVEKNGLTVDEYISLKKNKISTSVYDYMDMSLEELEKYKSIFNDYTSHYYTSTKKLFEIYSSNNIVKKPDAMIHDICDGKLFLPYNLERFEYPSIKDRKLIIGWVGNSVHSGENGVDLKGFRTIIKPAVDELKNAGYLIDGYYADRNEKWLDAEEMPNYYSKIDICICASVHEGTPRPVLEAMYSGIPIISTDVGIVNEAFGKKQHEFIIGDRNNGKNDEKIKEMLKAKIIYLYNNRDMFKQLSEENIISIKNFDGGKTIEAFDKFFEQCLLDTEVVAA